MDIDTIDGKSTPYNEDCLKITGHEKRRYNGLAPRPMSYFDNKIRTHLQQKCPICKMYVVWLKK